MTPVNHVLPAWDLLAGLHAALSLPAAERARSATGQGKLIEINLTDVALATMAHLGFVADAVINSNERHRDGNYLYGSYGRDFTTAEGRYVMVVALTRRHWHSLVQVTGTADVMAALEQSLDADFDDEGTRYRFRDVIRSSRALVRHPTSRSGSSGFGGGPSSLRKVPDRGGMGGPVEPAA
jgi:2-methylfumaryl-CoA isomerase